ncbi:MAG: carboxypeptidase-like regulatory domain-containing protein, partial [candidate division Zixibacteria bacterium]
MKTKLLVVLTVFICLVSGTVLSAVSGRITGVIRSTETGDDPVPGANVSVIGTSLGGVTDANGKYTILNVPVGTYT